MEIIPYLSVGQFKINMKKDEIRNVIKEEPKAFMKDEDEPAEHYVNSDILVYYNEDGETSNAFEFVENSNLTINGINFLNMKYKKAKAILETFDDKLFKDDDTLISFENGISLYILDNKVESLLVFEKGYYDEYFDLLAELDNET